MVAPHGGGASERAKVRLDPIEVDGGDGGEVSRKATTLRVRCKPDRDTGLPRADSTIRSSAVDSGRRGGRGPQRCRERVVGSGSRWITGALAWSRGRVSSASCARRKEEGDVVTDQTFQHATRSTSRWSAQSMAMTTSPSRGRTAAGETAALNTERELRRHVLDLRIYIQQGRQPSRHRERHTQIVDTTRHAHRRPGVRASTSSTKLVTPLPVGPITSTTPGVA